jgi:C-terminal processing protease CtpA/Prc
MSFESLNVRLTRSNPSISWGFELQQRGNDIIVSKIEPGSMAEKAGILRGDTVYEILNQKAGNLNSALGRIQNSLEITMTLRRPIKGKKFIHVKEIFSLFRFSVSFVGI